MKTFDAIAEELLKIPHGKVSDDLSPQDVPEWDSMNYLLFIAEIEKEFSISFTMDEVVNAKTLGDVRSVVEKKKTEV